MPPPLPPSDRDPLAGPPVTAVLPIGWKRLVLLFALLNAPLFFNGCESQEAKFTVGAAIPFAEIGGGQFLLEKLHWFSWPLMAANGLVTAAALWIATRRSTWLNRVAASRWFVGILTTVALVFNSWLVWPWLWIHVVFGPQVQIAGLIAMLFGGPLGASEEVAARWIWLISARVYFVVWVAVVSGVTLGVRAFLRRYFFVRTGSRWQIQLGGLVIVMLILGAGVGMAIRLLMPQ